MIKHLLKWLAGALVAASVAMAQKPMRPLEQIGIRTGEDGAQFILENSEKPFFVKGFNYVRLRAAHGATGGDHATFDADTGSTKAHYDPDRAEAMFSALGKRPTPKASS